ncbi:MAG: HD domain-containing phosphohydrolase [Planctomycetota bacterium]
MPDANTAALEALVNAIYANKRYGDEHRAAVKATEKAAKLLARSVRGDGTLLIVFSEDRIIVGETIVNDPRAVMASIGAALMAHGFQTIRVRNGIERRDVTQFARDVMQQPGAEPISSIGTERLSAGVISDPSRKAHPREHMLSQLCAPVGDLHSGLMHENRINIAELENIAEAVLCSFTSQSSAVLNLVEIENHDQYTMAHSVNVSALAGALARTIGVGDTEVEKAVIAALLHDIGKREIPSSILLKNGPLSDQERRLVLNHPAAGARMLLERDDIPLLASVVAFEHHRRLDKRGYPEPASAGAPSLASQIVQIADIYDALRSNRPYRQGMTLSRALEIMSNDAGKAYDQALFEVFVDQVISKTHRPHGDTEDLAA